MSNLLEQLIQSIQEGKSCNEICALYQISNKQLFHYLTLLKNKGFFCERKYYSTGVLRYKTISSISQLQKYQTEKFNASCIITNGQENEMDLLVISDLHFGNQLERIDLVDHAFNYCIKNGIHLILCCGDMIDGAYSKGQQIIDSIPKQIEHFIHDYPFDKNIFTFGVGGDHDFSSLTQGCQDFLEAIKNYRQDVVINGYNNSTIFIKNDKIHLYHSIPGGKLVFNLPSPPIFLHGHSHKYSLSKQENHLIVAVPSLSDINSSLPTALELHLQFNKGYIQHAFLKQIYLGEKDYILNEIQYELLKDREVEYTPIKNLESFPEKMLEKIKS